MERRNSISSPSNRSRATRYSADSPGNAMLILHLASSPASSFVESQRDGLLQREGGARLPLSPEPLPEALARMPLRRLDDTATQTGIQRRPTLLANRPCRREQPRRRA